MHPPRILVLVTILGVLVTGCTPTPAPEPSPVPSVPTCVPEFGGEPFPCTQAEHDANQKMLARYAEAERVFREYNRLSNREAVEGWTAPSEALLALTAGEFRKLLPQVRAASQARAEFAGAMEIRWMRPTQPSTSRGSLAMVACTDRSGWEIKPRDGQPVARVGLVAELVHFDEGSGAPRVADIAPTKDESCA